MYPRVVIDLNKFSQNVEKVKEQMDAYGIDIYGVTKVFRADRELSKIFADQGLSAIADSRIRNLKKIAGLPIPKVLLRLPMHSEISDVITFSDMSLCSELSTMELLSEEAVRQHKTHGVILMTDLGDLREGFFDRDELMEAVKEASRLEGIKILGIGTNLTCFGAIIPKPQHMEELLELGSIIEEEFGLSLQVISGGNSSSYYLVNDGLMPSGINNLRLGEIFVCGVETAFGRRIPGTYDDVFVLEAEIVELKKKPSKPIGESGMDAFGQKPVYEDKGQMLRAICAVGKQDVDTEGLVPMDPCVDIIGRSSDHMILNMTNCLKKYEVGDIVRFRLKYGGILSAMTSDYVDKTYINQDYESKNMRNGLRMEEGYGNY